MGSEAGLVTPFRVVLDDGRELSGKQLPVDWVATERHLGGLDGKRYEATMYCTFNALTKRLGHELGTFQEFLEHLIDYDEGDDALGERPADPAPVTQEAAPGSASASPPSATELASAPST